MSAERGFELCIANQGRGVEATLQVHEVRIIEPEKVVLTLSDGAVRHNVLVNKTVAERAHQLKKGDVLEAKIISVKNLRDNLRFFIFDYRVLSEKERADWSNGNRPPVAEALQKRDVGGRQEFNLIAELRNPDNSFLIRGRVISKEPLRPFKSRGGNLFSIKIRDSSGLIRATFFRSAANRFFECISVGKVYTFTGGEVEEASRYNNTLIPYEIIFKNDVWVEEVADDPDIPSKELSITRLSDVRTMKMNSLVDVLVVALDPGPLEEVSLRNGGAKKMRKVKIIDAASDVLEICVWGERAEDFDLEKDRIYLIKDIKVKEFQGERNLLVENFTEVEENVEMCDEYLTLLMWKAQNKTFLEQYTSDGPSDERRSPTRANCANLRGQPGLYLLHTVHSMLEDADRFFASAQNHCRRQFYNLVVHTHSISKKVCYFSCGIRDCKKKISESGGSWYCEKCRKAVRVPKLRFMADLGLADSTGSVFARIFGNENCLDFFSRPIHEIDDMITRDEEAFYAFLKQHHFQEFIIRIMVRKELYEGEERNSFEILRIESVEKEEIMKKIALTYADRTN